MTEGPEAHPDENTELATLRERVADLERREADRSLTAKASKLLAQVSQLFLSREEWNHAMGRALELCGEFMGADRVRVFRLDDDLHQLVPMHEWRDVGVAGDSSDGKSISTDALDWAREALLKGRPVAAADVAELPPLLAERLGAQNIRSLLVFPLIVEGRLDGVCAAAMVRDRREWSNGDRSILRQVAELIGRAMERQRHEDRLQRSLKDLDAVRRQNDAVMRSTPHGLCLINSLWQMEWANQAMARILGAPDNRPQSLYGRRLADHFPSKEDFDAYARGVGQSLRGRESGDKREVELVRLDGQKVWCEISLVRHDPSSTAMGLTATVTDVSDRRRAELALRDSERRFRSLVQNSTDMIIVYAADGRVTYANPAVSRDLGFEPEELVGEIGIGFVHPDDLRVAVGFFATLLKNPGKSFTTEFRVRHKDGSWRHVEGIAVNLLDDPSVGGFVANSRDVTERKLAEEALRDSEAMYTSLVEGLTQNLFRKDAEGRFTYVNENFCVTTGRRREEIVGKTDFDFYPPELAEKYRRDDLRVMEEGEAVELVEEHAQPDGSISYVQVVKTPVRDSRGRAVGLQGIFWDMTERRRAEEALRASEERYRDFIANLPLGVFRTTPGKPGRFVQVNPAMVRMLGYDSEEDLAKCGVTEIYADPEDRKRVATELIERDQILNAEMKLKRKDGSTFWTRSSINTLRDKRGRIVYFDGVVLDISARKAAQEALVRSEELHRLLLENIADGVFEVDRAGNLTYANPAILRMIGREGQPYLGLNNREFMDPETQKGVFEAFNEIFRTGQPKESIVFDLSSPDGESRCVEGSISLVRDAEGRPSGFRGVVRDISERRRAERALAEKTVLLERANQDLVRKNAELDEFTYIASHDLQEPLRKLTAFSDILRKDLGGNLPDRASKDLGFIVDAASRMQNLVQDLLHLSRAGKSAMKRELVPLGECARKAVDALQVRIETTGARVEIGELPEVWGDRTMLTQLYQNLVGNALKFVKDRQPEVRLTCVREGDRVIMGVSDNGIGIKPEYSQQIFAPFKRLHGRSEFEGSGIGLSICRKCVERHGGTIWVESEPGQGSHFRFTIGERVGEREEGAYEGA